MSRGVVYVAFGDKARAEAQMSLAALRRANDDILPVAVIAASPLGEAQHLPFDEPGWGARWAKLNLDRLTPFEQTLYLDADTRPRADLSPLLAPLADGFDLVVAESTMQAEKALWHVERQEREDTLDAFGFTPLQLQAGVLAFRRSEATSALFAAWREEWLGSAAPTQDQAALLRALYRAPVKVWLVSRHLSAQTVAHVWGRLH